MRTAGLLLTLLAGCGLSPPKTDAAVIGSVHEGQYHLGPVDFAESQWPNACSPTGGYAAGGILPSSRQFE